MAGVGDHQTPDELLPEDLLQWAWGSLRWDANRLTTQDGRSLQVLSPGTRNRGQGPDFLQAAVLLGGVELHGAIELHRTSAEWYQHGHDRDPHYLGVVLHVVQQASHLPIRLADGTTVPELALQGRLPPKLVAQYQALQAQPQFIPCEQQWPQVPDFTARRWVQSLGHERLFAKAQALNLEQGSAGNTHGWASWGQVLWQALAAAMGGPVNQQAFHQLAQQVPLTVVQRCAADLNVLEALLLGAAGVLAQAPHDTSDDYLALLKRHWQRLAQQYEVLPLPDTALKYGRLRPAAFPSVRLAQLAALLHRQPHLMQLYDGPPALLHQWLQVAPSAYWLTHYRPGVPSAPRPKGLGTDKQAVVLINAVIPVGLRYHQLRGHEAAAQQLLEMLDSLPPEENAVVRGFRHLGFSAHHALEGQGLIQLQRVYCAQRKCLTCSIGNHILKSGNV